MFVCYMFGKIMNQHDDFDVDAIVVQLCYLIVLFALPCVRLDICHALLLLILNILYVLKQVEI